MSSSATGPAPTTATSRGRWGGLLWVIGAIQFVIGMIITQLGWTTSYSLINNYISDLGAVNCGYWPAGSTRYICSPWHEVFNVSIVLLGLLFIAGAILVRSALPAHRATDVGLVMVALAGLGSIGVGLSPEDVNLTVHSISALIAFLIGNLALIVLGSVMTRNVVWKRFSGFSIACGVVGLVALILFTTHLWGPLGVGGSERLIVAPTLLWAAVIGLYAVRRPTSRSAGPILDGGIGAGP
jgi:hypothetical membrane protein